MNLLIKKNSSRHPMRTLFCGSLAVIVFWGLILISGCSDWSSWPGKPLSEEDAVRKSQKSLGQKMILRQKFPWYSPAADDACFIPFPPERPLPQKRDDTPFRHFIYILMIVLAVMLLIPIIYFIVLAVMRLSGYEWNSRRKQEALERQRRIETLPEEAREVYDDLLGAAEKAFQSGNYRLALIYYFSHLLVLLDKSELIRMLRGKTNHEYLRELQHFAAVKPYYRRVMLLFESVYYGEHALVNEEFFPLWEERREVQTVVREEKKRAENAVIQAAVKTALILLLFGGTWFSGGCRSRRQVETDYAAYGAADESLNGITVFQDLCRQSGHTVRNGWLLKKETNDEVLVWMCYARGTFPESSLEKIKDWLEEKPDRIVVYVGRAFDAERDYWAKILPGIEKQEDKTEAELKRSEAAMAMRVFLERPVSFGKKKDADNSAAEESDPFPEEEDREEDCTCGEEENDEPHDNTLFEMKPLREEFHVTSLGGDRNWLEGMDTSGLRWSLFEEIVPKEDVKQDFQVLLESEGNWIAASVPMKKGRFIVVNNAGFLLNYQLIPHEHRKLANRLIREFGNSKKVYFLHSTHFIQDNDGDGEHVSSFDVILRFLQVWPYSILIWQCILPGIVFCFYKWPIFGRPRKLPQERHVNFGEHLTAYAGLLAATGEEYYVREQMRLYRKNQGLDDIAEGSGPQEHPGRKEE
ncbi:MAG: hypothetical protein LBQ54_03650 [Planctomycetaceae bacterium]|jgi:hypothetical protein|nr:hypothetical protein [Planctomycetaceae bacterium]